MRQPYREAKQRYDARPSLTTVAPRSTTRPTKPVMLTEELGSDIETSDTKTPSRQRGRRRRDMVAGAREIGVQRGDHLGALADGGGDALDRAGGTLPMAKTPARLAMACRAA